MLGGTPQSEIWSRSAELAGGLRRVQREAGGTPSRTVFGSSRFCILKRAVRSQRSNSANEPMASAKYVHFRVKWRPTVQKCRLLARENCHLSFVFMQIHGGSFIFNISRARLPPVTLLPLRRDDSALLESAHLSSVFRIGPGYGHIFRASLRRDPHLSKPTQ